ncbi:hypothetical protein BH10BDE1_BH10BDE1_20970 [soil metagenome]
MTRTPTQSEAWVFGFFIPLRGRTKCAAPQSPRPHKVRSSPASNLSHGGQAVHCGKRRQWRVFARCMREGSRTTKSGANPERPRNEGSMPEIPSVPGT